MKNKINIAELIKDCPKGMELDCTMFDDVIFICVDEDDESICIRAGDRYCDLTNFGTWTFDDNAKCVIFPKGKTTWEGFIPPCKFKDGDIIFVKSAYDWILIYKESENKEDLYKYVAIPHHCAHTFITYNRNPLCSKKEVFEMRLATEEEKQKLFDTIKKYGYHWNEETKSLAELVPDKFDVTTLKPFDKVLCREKDNEVWSANIYSHYNSKSDRPFVCIGWNELNAYTTCVPYEKNEHLLGTNKDCDEFYKNW